MNDNNNILQRIESSWQTRARVRNHTFFLAESFDHDKLDFLPEWLPFGSHPEFLKLPNQIKSKILSIDWLLYNQATIDIEYKLVIPFCLKLMENNCHFNVKNQWKQLLFQTITDESYHVQLTEHASELTRKYRKLEHIQLPTSNIIEAHNQFLQPESWKNELINLAVCVVTEIIIGEHLSVVGKCADERLQPLTKETTKIHMMDEKVHATIFAHILREHYVNFNEIEKNYFNSILPTVVTWFISNKLEPWKQLLPALTIETSAIILKDSQCNQSIDIPYDLSKLTTLAEEFGLYNLDNKVKEIII